MESAIAHLEAAERELALAIRAAGVGSVWDRRISFAAFLLIVFRIAMRELGQ